MALEELEQDREHDVVRENTDRADPKLTLVILSRGGQAALDVPRALPRRLEQRATPGIEDQAATLAGTRADPMRELLSSMSHSGRLFR